MNADGFELLHRIESEPELLALIDRCAWYSRQESQAEKTMFDLFASKNKDTDTLTVHLLMRLLSKIHG